MNSRTKGHGFERWCAAKLRAIWPDVQTCRYAGNLWLDHCGVDLVGTPGYNVQLKAVERLSPGYHEILEAMPKGNNTNILIHKRNRRGIVVAMKLEDFESMLLRHKTGSGKSQTNRLINE